MLINIISSDRNLKIIALIYRLFVSQLEREKRHLIFGQTLFVSRLKVHLDTKLKIGLYRDWETKHYEHLTHAYALWAANVLLAVFAPAFPLSFHDRKSARRPPKPIASVVRCHSEKLKDRDLFAEKSLTNCPLFDIDMLFRFDTFLPFSGCSLCVFT